MGSGSVEVAIPISASMRSATCSQRQPIGRNEQEKHESSLKNRAMFPILEGNCSLHALFWKPRPIRQRCSTSSREFKLCERQILVGNVKKKNRKKKKKMVSRGKKTFDSTQANDDLMWWLLSAVCRACCRDLFPRETIDSPSRHSRCRNQKSLPASSRES